MNWLKKLFSSIRSYFKTGRAASDAQKALEFAGKALPFVRLAGDLITRGLIPGTVDDAIWEALKLKFPTLFDGQRKTPDELKLAGLAAATELMRAKYPNLDTSIIRKAIELAYGDYRAEQESTQ